MGLSDFFRRKPKSALDALQFLPQFQQQKELFDAMNALCESGVDADEMPNGTGEFGLAPTNPIPCRTLFGSTAYLGRLRACDGTKVAYDRAGSTQSPVSPHPIDVYEVTHERGRKLATLYISPYQKRISAKAQDADGIIYYFKGGETVLTELPDGRRIIERDGNYRFEDADGNEIDDVCYLEAYEGYLVDNECSHPLYKEPQETFDTYSPEIEDGRRRLSRSKH